MIRHGILAAAMALTLVFAAPRAEAALISGTVNFSGTNTGPVSPFAGSFNVTFDNSANISDTVAGLSNVVLPFTLSSGNPAYNYSTAGDIFVLGGSQSGVNIISGFTNDFILAFSGISTGNLTLNGFVYHSAAPQGVFNVRDAITLTFTPTMTAVPAPAALGLFGFGLLALAALRRRA